MEANVTTTTTQSQPGTLLDEARSNETRRDRELRLAALARFDGSMTQDELDGFVVRYAEAVRLRRELEAQAKSGAPRPYVLRVAR